MDGEGASHATAFNLVDAAVVCGLAVYVIHGFRRGAILIALELLAFFLSLAGAFGLYRPVGYLLTTAFKVPAGWSAFAGFFGSWVVGHLAGFLLLRVVYPLVPRFLRASLPNRVAGALLSSAQGLVLLGMALLLVLVLPVSPALKSMVSGSYVGGALAGEATGLERAVSQRFADVVRQAVPILAVEPKDNQRLPLNFHTRQFHPDSAAETRMLGMVNRERVHHGLKPLRPDELLRNVARAHAADMLRHGYFAHESLDGRDPFQRMHAAGVHYRTAGENLAYAQTLEMAHAGLMHSPGHRANILSPQFTRVGIAVMDAGPYGLMIDQDFAG